MTEFNREKAIEKLKVFQDDQRLTQARLAKMLGLNEGALSTWLKDEYKGNNEEIDVKVEKFLTLQAKKTKGKIKDFGFLQTSIAKQVFGAAQTCQIHSLLGVCYGDPGLGKTTAIKEYAKNNTGVVIIECEAKMGVMRVVESIYRKLNLGNEKIWNPQVMIDKIKNKLQDSGWLLIIDEAEHLSIDAVATLRRIQDLSGYTFGILFTGTYKFYNDLISLKGDYNYLTGRFNLKCELGKLTEQDISLLVKNAIPDADLDLIQEVYELSNNNARVLTNTIKNAYILAKQGNNSVDIELIKAGRNMLVV